MNCSVFALNFTKLVVNESLVSKRNWAFLFRGCRKTTLWTCQERGGNLIFLSTTANISCTCRRHFDSGEATRGVNHAVLSSKMAVNTTVDCFWRPHISQEKTEHSYRHICRHLQTILLAKSPGWDFGQIQKCFMNFYLPCLDTMVASLRTLEKGLRLKL